MNILITGASGVGKSILGDKIKNAIFKSDKNCKITIDDSSREQKSIGNGTNEYIIHVRQIPEQEVEDKADIIVQIKTGAFSRLVKEI
jgi:predicted GTPase